MNKQKIYYFLCSIIFLVSFSHVLAAPLFTTAVASYTMEDTTGGILQDFSSNNHDANNQLGGATVVSGLYGNALQFDGTDQVRITSASDLVKTTAFTIEASFRVDAYTSDWVRVVGKGNATSRNYGLWYNNNSNYFLFQMYGTTSVDVIYTAPVQIGHWYHIAGVWTGSVARLYLDGVLVASANYSTSPYTSTDPLTIGGADFHAKHIGLIDNVALFNGSLTSSDILAHSQGIDIGVVPEINSLCLLLFTLIFGLKKSKK